MMEEPNPPPVQEPPPIQGWSEPPVALSRPADDGLRYVIPIGVSGKAIAASYAGLFALLPFLGLIAIVLGIWALRDIAINPEKRGKGRAIFGLVMGIVCTLLWGYVLTTSRNPQ